MWSMAEPRRHTVGYWCMNGGWASPSAEADEPLWAHCRRAAAPNKPRSKAGSSSVTSCKGAVKPSEQPESDALTEPKCGRGGRRKRAPKQGDIAKSLKTPAQASGQRESPAVPAAEPATARSLKPRSRRKALVKIHTDPDASNEAHPSSPSRDILTTASAPLSSSAGVPAVAGSSRRPRKGSQPHARSIRSGSFCLADEPTRISEEAGSNLASPQQLGSPAYGVASRSARSRQPWVEPVEDAWCYIASSPEPSPGAFPHHADSIPSPRASAAQKRSALSPKGKGKAASRVQQEPISLLSSDSEDEESARQGLPSGTAAVGSQEKLGKRCRYRALHAAIPCDRTSSATNTRLALAC